jgi:hypothetical protein
MTDPLHVHDNFTATADQDFAKGAGAVTPIRPASGNATQRLDDFPRFCKGQRSSNHSD